MRRRCPMLILVAVLAAGGAACGGDGGPRDQANLPTLPGGTGTTTGADRSEAALALSRCMREHGVEDYPDPEVGESGQPTFPEVDEDDPDLPAATEACQDLFDGSPGFDAADPDVVAANQQRLLDFAQCMRDHGIDVPDPVFGDQPQAGDGGDEPADQELTDEFLDVEQACRSELPAEETQP